MLTVRSFRSGVLATTVALTLTAATSQMSLGACFLSPEDGAQRAFSSSNFYGIRSDVDVLSAFVGTGETITRRYTIEFANGEIVDFGIYKGAGYGGCPTNSTDWKVFAFSSTLDACFESSSWPEYGGGDNDIEFKMSWGSCSPYFSGDVFRVFTAGTRRDCLPEDYSHGQASVEGATWAQAQVREIDVHFEGIDRMQSDGSWVSVSSGSSCDDSGYRVRVVSNTNIWLEKYP